MAGLETVYGHYRYSSGSSYIQGDGQLLNNTTDSRHQYTSGQYGDSNTIKQFTGAYGTYYSGHLKPKINATQRDINAWFVKRSLQAKGFSLNAICGMCGNMMAQGGINPGVYEGWVLHPFSYVKYGVGIVQWTPYVKFTDWAKANGDLHIYDLETQCKRIQYQAQHNIQYGHGSPVVPMPSKFGQDVSKFSDFKISTLPPRELACNFWWHYEKPRSMTDDSARARGNNAQYFYQLFTGEEPPGPGPGPGPGPVPGDIPIWLLFKLKNINWRG